MNKWKMLGALTLAVIVGLGIVGKAEAADTLRVVPFILRNVGDGSAAWDMGETKYGNYSVKLINASSASYNAVDFVPDTGITLADFQAAIIATTPEYSFWHHFSVANGPQFELTFEDPSSDGWLEITAVGLQHAGTGAWVKEILAGATPAGFGGNTPDTSSVFEWGTLTSLSDIEAAVNTAWNTAETGTDASDYVLTLVQVELWENIVRTCYIDDITIAGVKYEVEIDAGEYTTIQLAIDAATAGDVIQVPAGTYDEDLAIGTANLTLESMVGKATTTIEGRMALSPGADNFVLGGATGKGFTLKKGVDYLIALDSPDNVTISYNAFNTTRLQGETQVDAIRIWQHGLHGLTVTENTFDVIGTFDQGVRGHATGPIDSLTITNNVFTGKGKALDHAAIQIDDLDMTTHPTVISGNEITGVMWGFIIYDQSSPGATFDATPGKLTISENTFDKCAWGTYLIDCADVSGDVQDVDITKNIFTDNTTGLGIAADDWQPGDFTVDYNNFSGNTTGISNLDDDGVLPAKYNWWGKVSGPYNLASNPAGKGDPVTADVAYVPWLDAAYPGGGATGGIPTELTIEASDSSVQAGAIVTITDTLKDVHGNPVYNKRIDYSVTGTGTVSPVFDTTTAWGYATTDFLAGSVLGTKTVRAELSSDTSINAIVDIVVAQGPLAQVKVTPESTEVVVTDAVTIVAELLDLYDNHIDAADTTKVVFSRNGEGIIGPKSLTADKKIQIVYTTDTTAATDTIIATTALGGYKDSSFILAIADIVNGDSSKITITGDNALVVSADSSDTLLFNVEAKDKYGNLTEDREITFTVSYGTVDLLDTTNVLGKFGADLGYYGGTEAQVVTLTATATDGNATVDTIIYLEAKKGCAGIDSIAITGANTIYIGEEDTLTFTYFDSLGNEVNIALCNDTTFANLTAFGTLGAAIPDTLGETLVIWGEADALDTLVIADAKRALVYGVQLKKSYSGVDTITVAKVDTIIATANSGAVADTFLMNVIPVGTAAYFMVVPDDDTLTVNNLVTLTITAFDTDSNRIYSYGEDDTIATEITLTHTGTADSLMWSDSTLGVVDNGDGTGTVYDTMFVDGQWTVELTNRKAETLTASVAETGKLAAGTSDTITWIPDALDHFGIVVQTDPIYTGVPFAFTVTPYDTFANITSLGLPVWIEFGTNETEVDLPAGPLQFTDTTTYTATASNASTSMILTVGTTTAPGIYGISDPFTVIGLYTLSGTVELSDIPGDLSGTKVMVSGGFFDSTDAIGYYAIPELLEDTYNIIVTHDGYQTVFETGVVISANTVMNFMLEKIVGIEEIPAVSFLSQNKPNPFAGGTTIEYGITKAGKVEIVVYNVVGQKVRTLVNSQEKAGYHKVNWDGTNDSGAKVGGGIYFYKITAGEFTSLKKLILLR